MPMIWVKYVLETIWNFEHSNTEFCTFTWEGHNGNLALIFAPQISEDARKKLMQFVKEVCNLQNGNFMVPNNCKPVALYRVVGPNRIHLGTGLPQMEKVSSKQHRLEFDLQLVGEFDFTGNPKVNMPQTASVAK